MIELVLIVAALIVGALTVLALYQFAESRADVRWFPAPGRLVNIAEDGAAPRQLHVLEMGAGRPAIVMESGISTTSLNWSLLQPKLAAFAATYSYDRAGLGWSDADEAACSVARIAEDLHALVGKLGVGAPYILVGHSFGGYIVRFYASKYPKEIAGVVMVDPLTPEEWVRPTRTQRKTLRKASGYARLGGALASVGVARLCFGLLQSARRETSGRVVGMFGSGAMQIARKIAGELGKLPPQTQRLVQMQWSRSKPYWSMSNYLRALPMCAAEVIDCAIPKNIPVTVISGMHQPADRLREHVAIAEHSTQGKHIIAEKSGHWIQFDEPELIVDAVRQMVTTNQTVSATNMGEATPTKQS